MKLNIFYIRNDSQGRPVYEDWKKRTYVDMDNRSEKSSSLILQEGDRLVSEDYEYIYIPCYMSQSKIKHRIAVERVCPMCGRVTSIYFNEKELQKYNRYCDSHKGNLKMRGKVPFIQDLFPERSKEERELMMSGYCYACQDQIFSQERFYLTDEAQFPMDDNRLIAYNRADHDGYRWWNNWFPGNGTNGDQEMTDEMEAFCDYLLDEMLGKGRSDIPKVGELLGIAPSEDREYNLFCEGIYCNYFIRLIDRKKDYHVYIKVFAPEEESQMEADR